MSALMSDQQHDDDEDSDSALKPQSEIKMVGFPNESMMGGGYSGQQYQQNVTRKRKPEDFESNLIGKKPAKKKRLNFK